MFCIFSVLGEAPAGVPDKLFVFYPGEAIADTVAAMKIWVKSLQVLPDNVRYEIKGPFDALLSEPRFSVLVKTLLPAALLQSSGPLAAASFLVAETTRVPRTDVPVGQRGMEGFSSESGRDRFGFQEVPVELINADAGGAPWGGGGSADQGTWTDVVQQGGAFVEVQRYPARGG